MEELLFKPGLVIENRDILLRVVSIDDLPALFSLTADPVIWKYFAVDLSEQEKMTAYVRSLLNDYAGKRNVPFVIIDKRQQHRIAGMSSFGNISIPDRRIEIGWSWLGTEIQGTGVNGIYKHLMLRYAFDVLDLIRVEFKTDVLNTRARKGLLKIGTTEEGVLRSHTQMHSNRRRDTIFYSILKDEWNLLKAKDALFV